MVFFIGISIVLSTSNKAFAATNAFWHLEEQSGSGAYLLDSSGNNLNATPTGTTSVIGKSGRGRQLTGSTTYISFPTNTLPSGNTAFTIDVWVKFNSLNTSDIIVAYGNDVLAGKSPAITRNSSTGKFNFDFGSGVGNMGGTTTVVTGVWYYVAVTYDKSNIRIYVNGSQEGILAFTTANIDPISNTGTYVGAIGGLFSKWAPDGFKYGNINAIIDEVRISNTAFSASTILSYYQGFTDSNSPSLSANNSSSNWFNTLRSATVSASDDVSLTEVRYNWGSQPAGFTACTSGGTVTSNGTVLNSATGGTILYLCARDSSNNVSNWSGTYNWETTIPSTPGIMTTTWTGDHFVKTSFTASSTGSTDTGGSGMGTYTLWRSSDYTSTPTSCNISIVSGLASPSYSVSGGNLPTDGYTRSYCWTASDIATNTSSTSTVEYIRMDSTAPLAPSMVTEPDYTVGTSNTVTSTISTDYGIGLVQYDFCINTTDTTTGCTESGWITEPESTFNGLTSGNTYYYFIRSRDGLYNTTSWSASTSSTQVDPTPTPTNTPTPTPTDTPIPTVAPPVPTLSPIPGGTTVQGVASEIKPVLITDWNTNLETTAQTGITTVGVEDTVNANIKVAEMPVNFNTAPDWTGVTGATAENLAFFHSTQPISTITNGAASSYTLYIRKGEGDTVLICPGATSLLEVNLACSGGYYLREGETKNGATANVTSIDTVNYWKVSGLTSTGGMSILTGLKDTLSRLQVSEPSDHKITFGSTYGMIVGSTDTMTLSFPNFDLSSITLNDIELTDSVGSARTLASSASNNTWGVVINSVAKTITFSVPINGTGGYDAPSQIVIKVGTNAGGTNQITNPSSVGNKTVSITLNNTAPGEMGNVNIPIIDNDQVNITGYVTAYIHFDIDTGVGEVPGDTIVDCNYNTCLTHQNGNPGTNYTVDLGELTSAVVNKSNTTSVAHSSGGNGIINSIYFDISTNAPSGAVVTVKSANGGLQGPGANKIPSIGISTGADGIVRSDGDDIPANSGVYGYNLPVASSASLGSIIPNSLCDSVVKYCGADTVTPKTVFTTNNLPVDTARVRLDLAAAANYTNNPGLYTDTLTFIATATF